MADVPAAENQAWVYACAAGFAGAVSSLVGLPQMTMRKGFGIVIVGTFAAACLTAAVATVVKTDSPAWYGAIGYVLGLCGLSVTAAIMKVGAKIRDDPFGILSRWIGSPQKPGDGGRPL